jgi:uncharacterized glyoxalase superfamily protein PhnB
MHIGGSVMMIGQMKPDEKKFASPNTLGVGTQAIFVHVPNPDAHYQVAKAAGAEITRELEDQPWGSREYGVKDIEGHEYWFGTYKPRQIKQQTDT